MLGGAGGPWGQRLMGEWPSWPRGPQPPGFWAGLIYSPCLGAPLPRSPNPVAVLSLHDGELEVSWLSPECSIRSGRGAVSLCS